MGLLLDAVWPAGRQVAPAGRRARMRSRQHPAAAGRLGEKLGARRAQCQFELSKTLIKSPQSVRASRRRPDKWPSSGLRSGIGKTPGRGKVSKVVVVLADVVVISAPCRRPNNDRPAGRAGSGPAGDDLTSAERIACVRAGAHKLS